MTMIAVPEFEIWASDSKSCSKYTCTEGFSFSSFQISNFSNLCIGLDMGMLLTLYFCTFVLIFLYIGLSVCRGEIFRESEAWTTIIFLHEEKWANCLLCIFYFCTFVFLYCCICIFVFFLLFLYLCIFYLCLQKWTLPWKRSLDHHWFPVEEWGEFRNIELSWDED